MPKPEEIPDCPDVPAVRSAGKETRTYQIELITPMFGGGVETRVNDPNFPIRPTAIRGQLQFWWRATVGAQYATVKELRAEQTKIWGSTEHASRVQVRVENVQADVPEPCARIEWNPNARQGRGAWRTNWQPPFNLPDSALPYALFPFQGETPPPNQNATVTTPPSVCIRQAKFRLTVRCPKELWPHVEPAVWAWVNFGGLGARARRGCGAITGREVEGDKSENQKIVRELAPNDADDLAAARRLYIPELFGLRDWPTLGSIVLLGQELSKPINAWQQAIKPFKHFRQGVGLGRNGDDPKFPKRSRWPEPETVRLVTGQRMPKHQRQKDIPNDAFPRAEFGLPIVFHFKDEDKWNQDNPQADPRETVLYPVDDSDGKPRERMASPLILKPLALASGKALPLILRLNTPSLTGVELRRGDNSLKLPASTVVRDPQLSRYSDNSPLAGSPSGSAIEAFLVFAQNQGFTEVPR